MTLKVKFHQLLDETTRFFAEQTVNRQQDREGIERLRQLALILAAETEKPRTFERFLAFILGTDTIDARYPLHAIQLMCLVLHVLQDSHLKPADKEEIALAAFFADFGFRAVWLSHQKAHAGAGVFHLRDLGASWWTMWMERMVLFHHDLKMDPSPHHVFSIASHYLALTQGTGIDAAGAELLTPARAIEAMMENNELDSEGKKHFLSAFSVYPLGSWVRLSSGETGMVIANNPGNPLRPIIGVYQEGQSYGMLRSDHKCQEIDLRRMITTFISGDSQPTDQQKGLFLNPQLWIYRWDRVTAEDQPVPKEVADKPLPATANIPKSDTPEVRPLKVMGLAFEPPAPVAEAPAVIANFVETLPPAPPKEKSEPVPVAVIPVASPEPEKKPEVDAAELIRIGPEVLLDMSRTLEKLEVPLHQISHRCQNETASLPKEFKKFRQAIQEIRSYSHTLASFGDTETGMVIGILSIWEGELAAAEQQAHEARAYMGVFLLPWEQKKKEVQSLAQELRETKPAERWADIRREWEDSLKPGLELLATSLTKSWDQKQQALTAARVSMRNKVEVARRTKQLLIEKLSLMHFSRGIKLRKEKVWDEAIASFQKALALNPQFWEAHTYIGLCNLDSFDQADFKRRKASGS